MRVASDYDGNTAPAPCTNVEYGQVEDYRVTVSVLATGIETNNISCCDLNIFPNPFTNETFIEYTLKNSKKVTLEVYNMIGEKTSDILKNQLQAAGKFKYKLKMEKAGMYFVKFTTDDGSVMKRIVNVD